MFLPFCTLFLHMTLMWWTVFLQNFWWLFFHDTYILCESFANENSLLNRKHFSHPMTCSIWETRHKWAGIPVLADLTQANSPCLAKLAFPTAIFCILDNPLFDFVGTHNKINIKSRNIIYRHKTQKEPGQLSLNTMQTTRWMIQDSISSNGKGFSLP